jgi:hypothetical protein
MRSNNAPFVSSGYYFRYHIFREGFATSLPEVSTLSVQPADGDGEKGS